VNLALRLAHQHGIRLTLDSRQMQSLHRGIEQAWKVLRVILLLEALDIIRALEK